MQEEVLAQKIVEAKEIVEQLLLLIKPTEWKKTITKAIKQYHLRNFSLEKVTPIRLKGLHSVIVSKFYVNGNYKVGQWNENEFKTFIWLTFTYGNAIKKHPFSFEQEQWDYLSKCFVGKTSEFCQFQLKALQKKSVHVQRWTKEEDELLSKIIQQTKQTNSSKIKWMEVSQQFYLSSGKKFIRSAKVCREHWNTHLDPTILKCPWSFNEDLLLVKGALQYGKKWVRIVELLQHKRTEHDVKNRFFSLCGKYIKMKHLQRTKQDIEADQLYEWLRFLQQQAQGKNPQVEQKIQNDPPKDQQQAVAAPRPQQKQSNQFIQIIGTSTTQSPAMIISPLPLNFGSIMFSPMNIILRNDTDVNYNIFSFENLRS